MDKDLAEYALRETEKFNVEYAEVRLEDHKSDAFVLKNGNPEISELGRIYGLSVRVVINGALGFVSTNTLEKHKIRDLVENSVKIARASQRIHKRITMKNEKINIKNYEVKEKIKIADISQEEKFNFLFDVEKSLPQNISVPNRLFYLYPSIREKYYLNSEGTKIYSKIPRVAFYSFITVMENSDTEQAGLQYGKSMGWEYFKEIDIIAKICDEIKALHRVIKDGKHPPIDKTDLILGPEVVGIAVHESCGHPYEADRIFGREAAQAGESFITPEMLGKQIGSEVVSVVDDPTLDGTYGYYLYDDEGVEARKRYLILNGRINEFLHNRETAAELGIEHSNASARANSYAVEPIVRMSNTYIEKGDYTKDEIFEHFTGVYIKSFTEWNIDDKRYNQKYVGRESYYVENGEIRYPIRRPILEITTPGFYSAVDAVGNDIERFAGTCGKGEPAQGIPVDMGGPTIRLRNVKLGGR